MDRRTLLRRSLPFVAVGLAGCTDGGGGTDTPTDAPTDSPTATSSPTEGGGMGTESPTDSPTGTDSPTEGEGMDTETPTSEPTDSPTATDSPTPESTPSDPDQTVRVGPEGELVFEPKSFEVSTGDTVLWVWDSPGHNVSPGSTPSGSGWTGKDADTYDEGATHAHTFEAAGSYEYHCDPHRSIGMTGSFTVSE